MDEGKIDWTSAPTDTGCVGRPSGRVDEASWEDFLAHLLSTIADELTEGASFALDLSGVDYMSSRGLRALTVAKRAADARQIVMTLVRPNDRMREILAISRYDKVFKVIDEA